MYKIHGGFFVVHKITAYHGTTADVVEKINAQGFLRSERDGTWLGHGAYFFEDGPQHALSWALNTVESSGGDPVVIEAEVELTSFIDLSDRDHWDFFREIYEEMRTGGALRRQIGPLSVWLPSLRRNAHFGHNLRDFDVVNQAVAVIESAQDDSSVQAVRCPFSSGRQIYPQSWFFSRSCIMLSVRDISCIKSWRVIV
jgi:hypothetical protein